MKVRLTSKKVLVLAAVITAAGLGIAYAATRNNSKESLSDPAQEIREDLIKDDPASGGNTTKGNGQKRAEDTNTTNNPDITIEVSQSYQLENGDLVIQAQIKGAGSGTCELSLTKGASIINRSADVLFQPSSSTCKGFTIPIGDFNEGGIWKLVLNLKINGVQTASAARDIDVKK